MLPEHLAEVVFHIPVPAWIAGDWGLYGRAVDGLLEAVNVEDVNTVHARREYFRVRVAIVDCADLDSHQAELLDVLEGLRPLGAKEESDVA